MSDDNLHDTLDQAQNGQTIQEACMGDGVDERYNSRLRQAFGASPFILTEFDAFINWVRGNSLLMLLFGIACCSIEVMHTYATKHDLDRFGAGVPRASPRQADVMDHRRNGEQYNLHIGQCIYCRLCEEVCPVDAIILTQNSEFVAEIKYELAYNI